MAASTVGVMGRRDNWDMEDVNWKCSQLQNVVRHFAIVQLIADSYSKLAHSQASSILGMPLQSCMKITGPMFTHDWRNIPKMEEGWNSATTQVVTATQMSKEIGLFLLLCSYFTCKL